jgi:hypothetical protein
MMGYDSFSITTIDIDKFNNKVLINFNQDVQAESLNTETVKLTQNGTLMLYTLSAENRQVIVALSDWPSADDECVLLVQNVKNVLEDDLETILDRSLVFPSVIDSRIEIISPANFASVSELTVELTEIAITPVNQYYIQVSRDTGFFDVAKDIVVTENVPVNFGVIADGQYYVRARAQSETDVGQWSKMVTATVAQVTPEEPPISELDPVFETELEILSTSENGYTPTSFFIEFGSDIDAATIGTITVIRRSV